MYKDNAKWVKSYYSNVTLSQYVMLVRPFTWRHYNYSFSISLDIYLVHTYVSNYDIQSGLLVIAIYTHTHIYSKFILWIGCPCFIFCSLILIYITALLHLSSSTKNPLHSIEDIQSCKLQSGSKISRRNLLKPWLR